MWEGEITLLNVKPAVGFTHPWAGVTPAPNVEKRSREDSRVAAHRYGSQPNVAIE